jgi:hypothetical protein
LPHQRRHVAFRQFPWRPAEGQGSLAQLVHDEACLQAWVKACLRERREAVCLEHLLRHIHVMLQDLR